MTDPAQRAESVKTLLLLYTPDWPHPVIALPSQVSSADTVDHKSSKNSNPRAKQINWSLLNLVYETYMGIICILNPFQINQRTLSDNWRFLGIQLVLSYQIPVLSLSQSQSKSFNWDRSKRVGGCSKNWL